MSKARQVYLEESEDEERKEIMNRLYGIEVLQGKDGPDLQCWRNLMGKDHLRQMDVLEQLAESIKRMNSKDAPADTNTEKIGEMTRALVKVGIRTRSVA
jgi:predicted hydrolase (HD superfamily)